MPRSTAAPVTRHCRKKGRVKQAAEKANIYGAATLWAIAQRLRAPVIEALRRCNAGHGGGLVVLLDQTKAHGRVG